MRPKIVMAVLAGAMIIVAAALVLNHRLPGPAAMPPSSAAVPVIVSATTPAIPTMVVAAQDPAPITSTSPVAPALSDEERQAKISAEIERINSVMGQSDSNSEALLMADVSNSEKMVRDLAIQAIKQTGDTNVVPQLRALASQTEDYEDRHALAEAADFLSLPSLLAAEQTWTPSATALPKPRASRHALIVQQQQGAAGPDQAAPTPIPDGSAPPQ